MYSSAFCSSCSALPMSTLSTSDGWCWNRSSSKSLKSLILSFPSFLHVQLDSGATQVPKFPVGGFPMSSMTYSFVWRWNLWSVNAYPGVMAYCQCSIGYFFPFSASTMKLASDGVIGINPSSIPGNLVVVLQSGLKRIIMGENYKFTLPFCRSVRSSSPFIQYCIMDNTSCSICDIGFCREVEEHHCFHSHSASYTVFWLPLQSSRVSGKCWEEWGYPILHLIP